MKQAEFLLYDSVRTHEPKNPKTLKKYHVAFFYSRNSDRPPFIYIEKNEKCQNDKLYHFSNIFWVNESNDHDIF